MAKIGVLRTIEGGRLGFWCPGCQQMHVVTTGWSFNGDHERPTFAPSVLVTGVERLTDEQAGFVLAGGKIEPKPMRCHSFVRDGFIQFLGDSTHALAGQTVRLPDPDGAGEDS